MAYKTDQSGFSWGLKGKDLETWRRRSAASKKAAETISERREALERFKGLKDERIGLGAHERYKALFEQMSKSQRDKLRDDAEYTSGDILEAAEALVSSNPEKYLTRPQIEDYIKNVIGQRQADRVDLSNPF